MKAGQFDEALEMFTKSVHVDLAFAAARKAGKFNKEFVKDMIERLLDTCQFDKAGDIICRKLIEHEESPEYI